VLFHAETGAVPVACRSIRTEFYGEKKAQCSKAGTFETVVLVFATVMSSRSLVGSLVRWLVRSLSFVHASHLNFDFNSVT
jgi:hypothetical protein